MICVFLRLRPDRDTSLTGLPRAFSTKRCIPNGMLRPLQLAFSTERCIPTGMLRPLQICGFRRRRPVTDASLGRMVTQRHAENTQRQRDSERNLSAFLRVFSAPLCVTKMRSPFVAGRWSQRPFKKTDESEKFLYEVR